MKKLFKENYLYFFVIIIVALLCQIKLPFYINAPGGIIDISNRIEYEDKKEMNGSLNMLYVTEYVATIPTYLLSYVIPSWDLESITESQVEENETTEEIEIRNKAMLDNSIESAKYVAYKALNKEISVDSVKNIVIATTGENNLKIGDEIISVDSKDISSTKEIKDIILAHQIGDNLTVKLKRNNKNIEQEVEIKEEEGEKVIGIVILTNYTYKTDPEIKVNFKKSESGSSGGLMMSLSIYLALSDEDILKGRNVAGTGTISIDGTVGEIAGIKYKIMGAAKNGMDVVLVPKANYKEALKVVKDNNYDLEIVQVETFEDAINYLKNN